MQKMANDSCELPFYGLSNDQLITLFQTKYETKQHFPVLHGDINLNYQ
jgi:hypothetical protein